MIAHKTAVGASGGGEPKVKHRLSLPLPLLAPLLLLPVECQLSGVYAASGDSSSSSNGIETAIELFM